MVQRLSTTRSLGGQALSGLTCDAVGNDTTGKALELGNDNKKCFKELNPITV